MWSAIRSSYQEIQSINDTLEKIIYDSDFDLQNLITKYSSVIVDKDFKDELEKDELKLEKFILWRLNTEILSTWDRLQNLSNMYEEICREWFLPTYLSQLTS